MNRPPHTSKHKRHRQKFWAFMLLGLNRVLYHDFVPPWGFEFLVRVNAQAWWYYAQYGFGSRYEMPGKDGRGESSWDGGEETLHEDVSVGDRDDGQRLGSGVGDEWDGLGRDGFPGCHDQTDSEASSLPGTGGVHLTTFNSPEAPEQDGASCIFEPGSPERSWSFSSARLVHCSLCCAGVCGDADRCYLHCSCRKEEIEAESLLPRFDWEDIDFGEGFGDLF